MIKIYSLREEDLDDLVKSFAKHNWHKPRSIFEGYLFEQESKKRQVWVAHSDEILGYVTLSWCSEYRPFLDNHVPEVMDLNVLPPFRKKGVGSMLMDRAETAAGLRSGTVGIGVGLYEGYGEAQKLYVKRGYIPDGRGPTYRYRGLKYGQSVVVDDDLVMWFEKKLLGPSAS